MVFLKIVFKTTKSITYEFPADVNADNFKEKGYSAFLKIPENYDSASDSISLISDKQLGISCGRKNKRPDQ